MAWNMIPPSDGELEELIEKDAMNDQDVGDLVDYLLKDGDDDEIPADPNGRKRAGAKGATLPKTRNGSSPDQPATNGVKAENGKRRASNEAAENGNGTGKAPAGLSLRTSRSLSLEIGKRNSGTRFNVVDDGDDMDVETPTKKTRINNLSMRDSDSDRSRSISQISFDGPLISPQNQGFSVWDTVNSRVKAEPSNGHSAANGEGKGAANGPKSFKHALNTSQSARARAVSADRDKASTCDDADLKRYSNGSEECKYLIKSMAEPLRRAYFRLIDHKVITEYDVDNMCLQKLCTLGCKESLHILSIFAEEAKYTSFRNVSAYLAQVIANQASRIKDAKAGEAGKAAGGDSASEASEEPQAHAELLPKVEERLNGLFKSGQVDKKMMDAVLYQHLASLPETAAMGLLVTLEGIDMSKVRNFTAFFISLKNKYRKEALSSTRPARVGSWQNKAGGHSYNSSLGGGHAHGATAGQWRRSPGHGSSRDGSWRDKSAGHMAQSALKDHTKFQVALGVRTSELHKLSPFAQYTPGSVALHMQNMHDKGIEFVTLLDDRSWKALTMMEESLAISVITDVGERLKQDMINEKMGVSPETKRIRNVNAFFLDVVKKQSELVQGLGANRKLGDHISSPFSSPNSAGGTPGGFNQVKRNLDPKRFEILSKETKKELDLLVSCSRGLLTLDMFDSRACNLLSRLGDENMKLVSDQLRKMDTRRIRNLFAFFLGMCRNYINGSMVKT